jgi:RHS repeat-associated protein
MADIRRQGQSDERHGCARACDEPHDNGRPLTPVAVLQPSGRFCIAPDHLGAPHQITDAGGAVVWQWNPDPFGNGDPVGAFPYELRFPGQFFDQATRLHYNYFHDYDPRLGRYLESDPIGLADGINTYAYVGGNPVSNVDPRGADYGTTSCAYYTRAVSSKWWFLLLQGGPVCLFPLPQFQLEHVCTSVPANRGRDVL